MDMNRYRCLQYAYEAGKIGGTMPTVLNAANEVAVQAFLEGKISFLQIEECIEKALTSHNAISSPDLQIIEEVDRHTREFVTNLIHIKDF